MKINDFIRIHRRKVNLTQKELSQVIGYSSPQIISNIERGLCDPPIKSLKKLARTLKLNANEKNDLYNLLLEKYEATFKKAIF